MKQETFFERLEKSSLQKWAESVILEKSPVGKLKFDGETIDDDRDTDRLNCQLYKVAKFMQDGAWRTLDSIAFHTGAPEASVSARLRDLRKPKFGSHIIERRYVTKGLFEYRMDL